ncbi:uncharacterized protein JCM6883_004746 [Sporobolomyces salmoneus]|uniref:uncharacterized protein n=1 Tax=Sporobolomyces salmoneus TaxID=183962 RepID=UPI0031817527
MGSYDESVQSRQALYEPPPLASTSKELLSISFNCLYSIPHSTQIHSFATTPCCTNLYSGGSDGFVRRYSLYSTLNSTTSTFNLTVKQSSAATQDKNNTSTTTIPDNRPPVLTGYWENEDPEPPSNDPNPTSSVKWGTKTSTNTTQSGVYSLAVHSQELWGLSGTAKGSINLFTIRHDQGQIRHQFKPDDTTNTNRTNPRGHSSTSPVSVLTIDPSDETSFLSGGWDGRIFDWDLNDGKIKQSFLLGGDNIPSRQISSISYQPTSSSTRKSAGKNGFGKKQEEGEKDAAGEEDTDMDADADADADADGEMDADADGEVDDTLPGANSTTFPTKPKDSALEVPILEGDSEGGEGGGGVAGNCFMSTSLDGLVLLWDKRIASSAAKGKGVHRLPDFGEELERLGLSSVSSSDSDSKEQGGRGRDKWSTSACWSLSGDEILVSRHSSLFSSYDLRSPSLPVSTYVLPCSTGPITSIRALSNRRIVTGSWDCVRVWDLEKVKPFEKGDRRKLDLNEGEEGGVRVVSGGHYGGTLSAIHVDPLEKWMFTTSGTRGWDGTSTENLLIHEIV